MKKEINKKDTEIKKEKKQPNNNQIVSDNRITNPTILKKYDLTESVNPQMLME